MGVRVWLCGFLVVLTVGFVPCLVFAQSEGSKGDAPQTSAAEPPAPADDAAEAPADDAPSDNGEAPSEAEEDDASSAEEDELVDEDDVSLKDLLETEIASGSTGSFGYRLEQFGVTPYLHGYAVVDFLSVQEKPSTFDLRYFNVFIGADINGVVVPEIQLEHKHGGDEIEIRFAQVDVHVASEKLIVRVGKFLTPFGSYNEFLYPEFITKTPHQPLALGEIVPVSWPEVGLQLRGKLAWSEGRDLNYALYVVNGLQQQDADPDDGVIDDGGSIREMRGNSHDEFSGDKAIGGRIGLRPLEGLHLGVSGYSGAYTVDGTQRLTMGGVDLDYTWRGLTVRGEYVMATQHVAAGDPLNKWGFYLQLAYLIAELIEPVVMFDRVILDGDAADNRSRFSVGVNLHPYPDDAPSLVVKASYTITQNQGTDVADNMLHIQLALGF